jgi:hypothetical protein
MILLTNSLSQSAGFYYTYDKDYKDFKDEFIANALKKNKVKKRSELPKMERKKLKRNIRNVRGWAEDISINGDKKIRKGWLKDLETHKKNQKKHRRIKFNEFIKNTSHLSRNVIVK